MKAAKGISFLGMVAMMAVLFFGFTQGDFGKDGGELLRNPWGIVSLVDLYVGFILFSLWIYYRERYLVSKVVWIVAMMVFGFLTASVYVLWALLRNSGDVLGFFLGAQKDAVLTNLRN